MAQVQSAAQALGLDVVQSDIRKREDIPPAFDALKGQVDALYVYGEAFTVTNRVLIGSLALATRLPTLYAFREFVEAGGLVCYGPHVPDMFRRAGDFVDKILRGAKPANLPVEQPTKFELVVNLITAKVLGVTVPPSLLARAYEVIE